jgi:hypothetical protein
LRAYNNSSLREITHEIFTKIKSLKSKSQSPSPKILKISRFSRLFTKNLAVVRFPDVSAAAASASSTQSQELSFSSVLSTDDSQGNRAT